MLLHGAEPFLLPGGQHGVLLIHGFTGLPAELRLLGEYLNARGFTVLAIRLAGHGTTVEDLSRMGHEDWMDSVRDGYAILSGICERVSIVGHSMGAVFAMLLSIEVEAAHVVSICAPIMIAPEQGIEHLPTREACIDRYVPKARRKLENVPQGANNTYRRMPLVSIHEVMDVIDILCKEIERVSAPILIMHGARDHTADPKSADYLYENIRSARCEKFILSEAGHLLPLDIGIRERVFERTAAFLLENTVQERAL
jgi:monoglyceride lipase